MGEKPVRRGGNRTQVFAIHVFLTITGRLRVCRLKVFFFLLRVGVFTAARGAGRRSICA